MKSKHSFYLLAATAMLMLPSCMTHDASYERWLTRQAVNPSADEIIGAWRREDNQSISDNVNRNILFQSGGAGHSYATDMHGVPDLAGNVESIDEFGWSYKGQGVWKCQLWGFPSEIRITEDRSRLLVKQIGLGTLKQVYIRQ